MDVVGPRGRWTTGRSPENGGAGDSSVLTAFGVFQGMRASAQHLWGDPTLRGRKVGVAGVGKVGPPPGGAPAGGRRRGRGHGRASRRWSAVRAAHPQVDAVADTEALIRVDLDVYAPCALGGALNDATVPRR